MANRWWDEDDTLLAALKEALAVGRAVPNEFVDAGKAMYGWRTIDAELASLTYDSAAELAASDTGTRAEPASLRALTFTYADMTIDLEVTPAALVGQISPAEAARSVVARTGSGDLAASMVDEVGYFTISPVPSEPFRLLVRTAGARVLTGWISP